MIELLMRARRRDHGGFTLIELLVVIIIMGVLSAVVVFAVRGVGDKGRADAIATEARILRTAQEAYCARENKYAASVEELKAKRYLSSDAGYHRLLTTGTNNCNGTSYTIDPIPNPGPSDPPDTVWETASAPVDMQVYDTVELEDGRVLATGKELVGSTNRAAIWDPTATSGSWTDIEPNQSYGPHLMPIGLITGPRCGNHCGKAMYYFSYRGYFEFYNPVPPQSWEPVPGVTLPVTTTTIRNPLSSPSEWRGVNWETVPNSDSVYQLHLIAGAKLLTTGCGDHCGKMLIVPRYCGPCNPAKNRPVLYDPLTNSFVSVVYPSIFAAAVDKNFEMAPLADGRVLFFNREAAAIWDPAAVTDPGNSSVGWSAAAPSSNSHARDGFWAGTYQVLEGPGPQGRVFVDNEIFTPPPRGSSDLGSWEGVPECRPGGCQVVGFAGQKILGLRAGPANPESFLLDPDLKQWEDTPDAPFSNDTMSYPRAVRLTGGSTGSCGEHCGKILVTGKSSAELYVPT